MSDIQEPAQTAVAQEPAQAATPAQVENPRDKFISMLPEEIRSEGVFANFNDVGDLAKSYYSAAKMVGMDKNNLVAIPKEDTPEAWSEVYSKLGRPESPDKYNLEGYKGKADEEALKGYVEVAHKAGLNQKQIDAIFGKFFGDTEAAQKAMEEASQEQFRAWNDSLKKEYGLAHEQKLEAAVGALEKLGGPELVKLVEENPHVFKNPAFAKFAVTVAEKTGEGTMLANGQTTQNVLSPADAQQQISALANDPNYTKAILDKSHPQHDYYVNLRNRLFEFAYPGQA